MAQPRRMSGRPGTSKKPAATFAKATAQAPKKAAKATAKPAKTVAKAKPAARPVAARAARPVAHPAARAVAKVAAKPAARPVAGRVSAKAPPARTLPAKAAVPKKSAAKVLPPPTRSRYAEAVGTYERAMQALQGKRYRDAAGLLNTVVKQYPEEKELLERAQLYLRFCERQIAPLDATPTSPEERIYAATLALNAGDAERAVQQLTAALATDPANDHAEYMLGVALAVRGNTDAATAHLERAVALNYENRDLIAKEPELEALRQTEAIAALMAAPPPTASSRDKRGLVKPKAGR